MTKYKQYFKEMCEENAEKFEAFKVLHDKYRLDKKTNQVEYNKAGEVVVKIIREREDSLCSTMEKGKNNAYSTRLAEKFWEEVRAVFPLIDFVGVEIEWFSDGSEKNWYINLNLVFVTPRRIELRFLGWKPSVLNR